MAGTTVYICSRCGVELLIRPEECKLCNGREFIKSEADAGGEIARFRFDRLSETLLSDHMAAKTISLVEDQAVHRHFTGDQLVSCICGEARILGGVDGGDERLTKGESVLIPAMTWHGFSKASDEDCLLLEVSSLPTGTAFMETD